MKLHSRSLMGFMVLVAVIMTGCGLPHRAATFSIIDPVDQTVFSLGQPITIRFGSDIPQDANINRYQLQIFDNAVMVVDRIYPPFSGASLYVPLPQPIPAGGHVLFAYARAVYVNGTMSDWYRTQEVCILVGPSNGIGCHTYDQSANPLSVAPTATATREVLEIFPSETPTRQPLGLPTFTFSKNAFCRNGPDTSFPDVTAIVAGDTVDILNVSEDGYWYYVFWKQFDAKCWVATSTGVATGDLSGLKVLVGPELPQPGVPPAGKKATPAPPPCNPLIKVCP